MHACSVHPKIMSAIFISEKVNENFALEPDIFPGLNSVTKFTKFCKSATKIAKVTKISKLCRKIVNFVNFVAEFYPGQKC